MLSCINVSLFYLRAFLKMNIKESKAIQKNAKAKCWALYNFFYFLTLTCIKYKLSRFSTRLLFEKTYLLTTFFSSKIFCAYSSHQQYTYTFLLVDIFDNTYLFYFFTNSNTLNKKKLCNNIVKKRQKIWHLLNK